MKPIIDTRKENNTYPYLPDKLIPRDQFIGMFDSLLDSNNIIFVSGINEGCGVTTALAMFVERHCSECFSFFNDGFDLFSQESEVIEECLARQIYLYNSNGSSYTGEHLDLESQLPALKKNGQIFYFVFDGFEKLPKEKIENLRKTIEKLNTRQFRFIFSGRKDDYSNLLTIGGLRVVDGLMLPLFRVEEVENYFLPMISEEQKGNLSTLAKMTGGSATLVDFFRQKMEEGIGLDKYLLSDCSAATDFFKSDLADIKALNKQEDLLVIAFVAFAGIPLTQDCICRILGLESDELKTILVESNTFLKVVSGHVAFKSKQAQRFIRHELGKLQMSMSLLMIDFFEKHLTNYLPFLPPLYRQYKKGKLLNFLKSDQVLGILVEKQSQAALNIQCSYGFHECNSNSPISDVLTFSLFKSSSLEIEQGGLWDNEIEALTSIGDFDAAIALAQNVFIKEEKLKCYAIIAAQQKQQKKKIDSHLLQEITDLHGQIVYEHIPDMAIGLAKLLLPVDYRFSLDIVDRISKLRDTQNKDKLFVAMSITSMVYKPTEESSEERFDQFTSRITDDGVRQFADALKTLFNDSSVDEVLAKANSLPTDTQKLRLLQNWIPANRNKDNIFKAVERALKLVVILSSEQIPKGAIMLDIVQALPNLTEAEFMKVLSTLDNIATEIRYPSDNYTMVQLKAISTLVQYNEAEAVKRLVTLCNEIKAASSPSAVLNCYSIILRNYYKLGTKDRLTKDFMSEEDLKDLIEEMAISLLSESAYHLKVLEIPVKSLVTKYPDLVIKLAGYTNTDETRSRVIQMATKAYIQQLNTDKLDWVLLLRLINLIDYPSDLRSEVLKQLASKCYVERKQARNHLNELKKFYVFFDNFEKCDDKSEAFCYLYLVFLGQTGEEQFAGKLLDKSLDSWNNIQRESLRIVRGFSLGRLLSTASSEKAREIISQTSEIKRGNILSSSSTIGSYLLSIHIYVRALGASIRCGYATDDIIDNFQRVLDEINSPSDNIMFWGQLALNYYVAGKEDSCRKILSEKMLPVMETSSFRKSSKFNREQVFYNIAPILYLQDRDLLYNNIAHFDEYFQNACIEHTLKFILMKHPNVNDAKWSVQESNFSREDKEKVVDLLRNCKDDQIIYEIIDVVCRTVAGKTADMFSKLQKSSLFSDLSEIVKNQLPTSHGIKHDGYCLVCEAALQMINPSPNKQFWTDLETRIAKVPNKADQAFIYICSSQYIPSTNGTVKTQYVHKGFTIASNLSSSFDRMNRIDMCVTNSKLKHILASPKVHEVIVNILTDGDGNYESRKKMIDLAQQFDARLMDSLADEFDNDPARRYYKNEVENLITHQKRLGAARKEISSIRQLTGKEFSEYFEQRLSDQILSKAVTWSEDKLFDVAQSIYKHPLLYSYESFLALVENASRMTDSKKRRELVNNLCHIAFWNLKIVMSLSSGTKEKIDRIHSAIKEVYEKDGSLVHVGERKKAIDRIISWYEDHKLPELRIIDAYFNPEDLSVIKDLLNVNNCLKVRILTLTHNIRNGYEYQEKWDDICKDTNVDIQLRIIHYKENPDSGPLHNRHWVATDGNSAYGIETNSLSSYGNKESSIDMMTDDKVKEVLDLWEELFINKSRMYKGKQLIAQSVRIGED